MENMSRRTAANAKAILDGINHRCETLDAVAHQFPDDLQATESTFWNEQQPGQCNAFMVDALNTVHRETSDIISSMQTLESYIQFNIPRIEDGGNFGVAVQTATITWIKERRESLEKSLVDVTKYFSERGDAWGKIINKKDSKETGSSSDGDSSSTVAIVNHDLLRAVHFVDVRYLSLCRQLISRARDSLALAVDMVLKNKSKIGKPRGEDNSGMGMF